MAIIASIDGPNRLIYLHLDTAGAEVHPVDIYKEMRIFRRTDETLRKYDLFLKAEGYVPKGGGKFTPILVTCLQGTRIVPYDITHLLTITGEIITDEGTAGTACFDRSGLTPGVEVDIDYQPPQVEVIEVSSGSAVTEQDKLDIADRVWDEVLTGASHNDPTSAGRRLRDLSTAVITSGIAVTSTANTITLNGDASALDGAYDPAMIAIVGGTGIGQTRLILEYEGATKIAVVDRNWKVSPDATSEYSIVAHPGREHVNEGLAQGGTINTITLNTLASSYDDAYKGQIVFIRSGVGEDQSYRIIGYNGTTKVATVCEDWKIIPDNTSAYVTLPTSVIHASHIVDKMIEMGILTVNKYIALQ